MLSLYKSVHCKCTVLPFFKRPTDRYSEGDAVHRVDAYPPVSQSTHAGKAHMLIGLHCTYFALLITKSMQVRSSLHPGLLLHSSNT